MSRANRDLWTMAVRNIARRPRRSLLSILAIAVAAMTMTVMFALIAGIKDDLASNLQRYSTGQVLVEDRALVKAGAQPLALAIAPLEATVRALAARPGVLEVCPRITTGASVFQDGDAVFFAFMGQEFAKDPMELSSFLRPGGRLPVSGQREALVSTGLAEKLKLAVGDTLTAVTQTRRGSSNGMTFTVTGIVHPGLGNYQVPWLFTSLVTAQRFVKLEDGATSLLVRAQPQTQPRVLAADLQAALTGLGSGSWVARPWNETSSTWGLMDLAGAIYGVMGLLFFALASTVIINTMLMVVLERAREIGMLAALGMDSRRIRALFLAESAVLSGLGALGGAAVGCVVVLILGATGLDFTEAMRGVDMGVSGFIRPVLEPLTPVLVMLSAVSVALLFTLVPIHRLKRLPIVEALRGEL